MSKFKVGDHVITTVHTDRGPGRVAGVDTGVTAVATKRRNEMGKFKVGDKVVMDDYYDDTGMVVRVHDNDGSFVYNVQGEPNLHRYTGDAEPVDKGSLMGEVARGIFTADEQVALMMAGLGFLAEEAAVGPKFRAKMDRFRKEYADPRTVGQVIDETIELEKLLRE